MAQGRFPAMYVPGMDQSTKQVFSFVTFKCCGLRCGSLLLSGMHLIVQGCTLAGAVPNDDRKLDFVTLSTAPFATSKPLAQTAHTTHAETFVLSYLR
jgi:hypothetical protein